VDRPGLQKGAKIAVAMSGGVDSSAAALLLKNAGFRPIGVTLRFWVDPQAEKQAPREGRGCSSQRDINDARKVADDLDIPHYILDMQEDFYKKVVNYFLREYEEGRTPNPCIPCNRYLKFTLLLQKVRSLDINFLATGHYARNIFEPISGKYKLFRGKDAAKDQSYMLYMLTQKQFSAVLFPLGDFTKKEIRKIIRDAGLRVAEKKDSQEICFIPDNDYRSFLERVNPQSIFKGDILSTGGEKLGEHRGLPFYTIGQRKGLGLTSSHPLYVVDIDSRRNVLIVGKEEEIYHRGLSAGELNFVSGEVPEKELPVQVKIRYRAPSVPAILYPPEKGEAKVIFDKEQKAVTPGQAVVFYRDEEILGGGTITSSLR